MTKTKLKLSAAELNCVIEAITAANKTLHNAVDKNNLTAANSVYVQGSGDELDATTQLQYSSVTAAIAENLQQLVNDDEDCIIEVAM